MNPVVQKTNKPIVVAVGLFVSGYSFTRVFESLFTHLSTFFDIHWLGIAYKGEVQQKKNYTLHPCNIHGGDMYGAYGAAELAIQLQARTVFVLNDLYMLRNYEQAFLPLREKKIRTVVYAPLDGYFTDRSIASQYLFPDHLILYSQWAREEVQTAIDSIEQPTASLPSLDHIYHGVDIGSFKPASSIEEIKKLKQELFNVPNAADCLFILNANRYNERKDIEASINGFEKAWPRFNHPVYLCLHSPNIQFNLRGNLQLAVDNSIYKEHILLNPLGEEYIDDKKLLQLYQACEIGVNTSLGEGWGMISFEHAACGAAQVMPDHTVPSEIWKDVALLIPKAKPVQLNTNPFLMYSSDIEALADLFVKMVNDEKLRAGISAKCLEHTAKDIFSWEKIAEQWRHLL